MPLSPKQEPPYYDIEGAGTPTKYYIAILNQTGTDNPGQTVILDTIGINGWTRNSPGVYQTAVITGAFPIGQTTKIITAGTANNPMGIQTSADQAIIYTGNPLADENLDNTTVIITVYPT